MSSPTERTLTLLRKEGWTAAVVEKWNSHTKTRHDLFGCIDVLAIRGEQTLGIQATSTGNQRSRVKKILTDEEVTPLAVEWLAGPRRLEVWGWREYAKAVKRRKWRETRIPINCKRGVLCAEIPN